MNIDPASPIPLYRDAMRAASVGLAVNVGLGFTKLAAGIVGESFALLSDAVNSMGDSLTSLVTLAALWYAQQPPDAEHPYGHTRAEAIAASHVSLVILMTALYVGWEAIGRLGTQHAIPPIWTLWVAGFNVAIKEGLFWYKRQVGHQVRSAALVATAWDHRSDAFCSLAVLVGLAAIRILGPNYLWADEIAALIVVMVILWSGMQIFRSSTSELLDPQADPDLVRQLRACAEQTPDVRAVEKLWVRKTGMEYFVDIHIQVDAQASVEFGHRVGHAVKDQLVRQFAAVRDVLVHLEPFPHQHHPSGAENVRQDERSDRV